MARVEVVVLEEPPIEVVLENGLFLYNAPHDMDDINTVNGIVVRAYKQGRPAAPGAVRLPTMQVSHAVATATATHRVARPDGRPTVVLHNSNDLTVRLLPCDVVAKVAPVTE